MCLKTTFQTELGQLIDLITAPEDQVDLSKFSLEKCVFGASPLGYPTPSYHADRQADQS
jgi:hypothetical protein